jgi:hypothetical protein
MSGDQEATVQKEFEKPESNSTKNTIKKSRIILPIVMVLIIVAFAVPVVTTTIG